MTVGDDITPLDRSIVVMGVAGSGKTTIARALATRLNFAFIDADWLHSAQNVEKMAAGQPLSDDDRYPWLHAVGERMKNETLSHRGTVTACSALKRAYRDVLRLYAPDAFFVALDGSLEVIRSRIDARPAEIAGEALLASQFATLEPLQPDERGMHVDVQFSPDVIANDVLAVVAP
ncbi:MAG TPA: gluconokinase [Acidimicrobiales bacterium]|jgi:carbohydrate kinase (thermoresistant glucokinase family)|nr:gluconokinase [Acidimicrobiales bacterium]